MRNHLIKDEISAWVHCGVGRTVRLAKKLKTTHNAVSVMLGEKWNLSDEKRSEIKKAIKEVELDEVNSAKFVEGIVLRSTKMTFHHEKWISDIAKAQLRKFSIVYLSF